MKGLRIIGWTCWLVLLIGQSGGLVQAQEEQTPSASDAPTTEMTVGEAETSAPDPNKLAEVKEVLSLYLSDDNSAIKLINATSDYPVILEPWKTQKEEISGELISASMSAFLPLFLMLIGVQFLAFFVGAYGASKIFAPRHASLLNALIFASIPTILSFIGLLLVMTNSLPLIIMGNGIIAIAIVIALIIATMYLYDVGLLTMLLFAIVGNLITGVVMVVVSNILVASLTAQILGAGMDTIAEVYARNAAPVVAQKIKGLQPKEEELQQQMQAEKDKLEGLKTKETEAQEAIKKLQAEVTSKRQTPQLVYTAIGQLVDQNKTDDAIASYAEFAAKFPGHPLANQAKEQIEALESLKAQNEAELEAKRAAMVAEEKRQLAAFKQRLAKNQVTLSDIRKNVLGKSQQEVIELLGQADGVQANTLIYTEIQVFDPVRNRNRSFIINFLEGRVQGANYIR